jgi:putative transposase
MRFCAKQTKGLDTCRGAFANHEHPAVLSRMSPIDATWSAPHGIGAFEVRVVGRLIPWLGGEKPMKASQFSDAQKAFILKQCAEGVPVADICRKAGISPATYFNWKKKFEGMTPPEMRRLKQLEDENTKLLVADLSLDREMLQDVLRRKL